MIYGQIKEGRKFQVRTDKKIDARNDIGWQLRNVVDTFKFTTTSIDAENCRRYFTNDDRASKGFFQKAGVLTFLKTNTQLQIWFDDVLEVTWVYETADCNMRKTMTGLRFVSGESTVKDDVSSHFRYEIGKDRCLPIDFQSFSDTGGVH